MGSNRVEMRVARWVVIGTALVAAGTAFHLLMSPGGGRRAVPRPHGAAPGGSAWAGDRPVGGVLPGAATSAGASGDWGADGRSAAGAPSRGGPPQDEIDSASREAMRNFLRESAQDGQNGQDGK
jgi:hypothetical protein